MTFMDGHSLHVTIVRPLLLLLGSILLRGKQQQTHTKLLIFLIFFGRGATYKGERERGDSKGEGRRKIFKEGFIRKKGSL